MTDFPPTLRALPEQRTDEESVEDCGCLDAKGVLGSSCKLHMASFRYWRVFSQQRKLMGSSTQKSSGVHGCRRRVRFNEVPAKVPKVPEKVWEALVPTGFWRRFRRRFREALVQSQLRFNRVPEKVPEQVWEALEHAEVFPALGFAACLRNSGKNITLRLLGIPPKLIFLFHAGMPTARLGQHWIHSELSTLTRSSLLFQFDGLFLKSRLSRTEGKVQESWVIIFRTIWDPNHGLATTEY